MTREDYPALQRFYRGAGYRGRPGADERSLALREDGAIRAALRLSPLDNGWWLRGFWVAPACRGQGLGSRLLAALPAHLDGRACYCFAYPEAQRFYQAGGFRPLTVEALPPGLAQRLRRYHVKTPELVPMLIP
nr:GNAT family N-acetyltransferase [Motiliproteus sp. SC1-56]